MRYGSHRVHVLMAFMPLVLLLGTERDQQRTTWLNVALRVLYYLTGTARLTLSTGGPGGLRVFATVDTSYAMHDDLKSHSCWTLHMNTGGAFLSPRTKKQSVNTDSSTYSELVGAHLSLRDIQWARNFL